VIRRLLIALVLGLALTGGCGLWLASIPGPSAAANAAPSADSYTIKDPDLFVYVPSNAVQFQPVQILVAMHGMGSDGATFCQGLLATAERNGWIVVAPTFKYQDYRNPDLVLEDDLAFLPRLKAMLDTIPGRTGLATRDKVLLYGFSRGGQAVHRFATLYPERTLAVAAISAGSYTLPLQTTMINGRAMTVQMPYGVANMQANLGFAFNYDAFKRVAFRISVGANDSNPNDTPRAWDPLLGTTRPERAQTYAKALQDIGVDAKLVVYSGVGHQVTPQMRDENLAFLQSIVARNATRYGFAPTLGAVSYGAIANNSNGARR
jgi:predicted esterase